MGNIAVHEFTTLDSVIDAPTMFAPSWSARTAAEDPSAPFMNESLKYVVGSKPSNVDWKHSSSLGPYAAESIRDLKKRAEGRAVWYRRRVSSRGIPVFLEVTVQQTIASALEWPGWCRAGKDEAAALESLTSYAERYAPVAGRAGLRLPSTATIEVAQRVPGGRAAAFAAPECRRPFPQVTAEADRAALTSAEARRLVGLLIAVWATFDQIAAVSPAELRKGPRGGGRDRDELIEHVIGAETAYARKLGSKLKQPAFGDSVAIGKLREAITALVGAPSDASPAEPNGWTARYAARRIAWHVLEHAWEMQDRANS